MLHPSSQSNYKSFPYFFDEVPYPPEWDEQLDESLIQDYLDTENDLIICCLLQRYRSALVGIAMPYFKDRNAVEEFLMELYEKLRNLLLAVKQGEKNIDSLQRYLIRSTKNLLTDIQRRQQTQDRIYGKIRDQESANIQAGSQQRPIDKEDLWVKMLPATLDGFEARAEISPEVAECGRLKHLEGQKPEAIAQAMGLEVHTVYRHLEKVKKKLKRFIKEPHMTAKLLEVMHQSELISSWEYQCNRMRMFDRLSPQAIATELGLPFSEVCMHLHEGDYRIQQVWRIINPTRK